MIGWGRPGRWAALVAGCVALAACGSAGGSIPADQASQLSDELNTVNQQVDSHSCSAAEGQSLSALEHSVAVLPSAVDTRVRRSLADGTEHLRNLVYTQCQQPPPPVAAEPTQTATKTTSSQTTRRRTQHSVPSVHSQSVPPSNPTPDQTNTPPSDQGNSDQQPNTDTNGSPGPDTGSQGGSSDQSGSDTPPSP